MLVGCDSAALLGLDAILVQIEVDAKDSFKGSLVIVGLPDAAIKESKDRILSAISHLGIKFEGLKGTINLAPADLKKVGTFYDLPIALSCLASMGQFPPRSLASYLIAGELGLGGEVRPITGALSIALLAKKLGKKGVILPAANAKEAAVINEIEVYGLASLKEGAFFLAGKTPLSRAKVSKDWSFSPPKIDFADIKGQANVTEVPPFFCSLFSKYLKMKH
ncbi:MAG: ATP-binding protein [Chlamydiia bacterium]|nr:ATP-binding protein [Chlamydiia bacterium]